MDSLPDDRLSRACMRPSAAGSGVVEQHDIQLNDRTDGIGMCPVKSPTMRGEALTTHGCALKLYAYTVSIRRSCRMDRYTVLGQLLPSSTPFPIFANRVPAGFPSPAQDHLERHISLDELLNLRAPHVYLVEAGGAEPGGHRDIRRRPTDCRPRRQRMVGCGCHRGAKRRTHREDIFSPRRTDHLAFGQSGFRAALRARRR